MWSWERGRSLPVEEAPAELGVVTLGGSPAGVNLGGERRWLPVYSPGGYAWRPAVGDQVLVLKAGGERESPCVVGKVQGGEPLEPGQVRLSGGSCAILLGQSLELTGTVKVNGVDLEDYILSLVTPDPIEEG